MKRCLFVISMFILLAGCRPKYEPHDCLDNIMITHWFTDEDGTKYSIGCCLACPYESEEPYWVGDYYYSGSSPELNMFAFINDDYCEDYDYVYGKIIEAMKNDPYYMSAVERNELRDNHECIDYTVYSEETYTDEEGKLHTEGICKVCRKELSFIDGILVEE